MVEKKLGVVQRTVQERREATKSGGLVQGRKDAACRQGCRIAGSLGGQRRALISSSDHLSCSRDGNPCVDGRGAVRLMRRVDWTWLSAAASGARSDHGLFGRERWFITNSSEQYCTLRNKTSHEYLSQSVIPNWDAHSAF